MLRIFIEQTPETEIASSAQNSEELEEESDDLSEFKTGDESSKKNCIQPRWPTRVFAAECVRRIIATCQSASPAHFDLQLAKELHLSKNKGYLRHVPRHSFQVFPVFLVTNLIRFVGSFRRLFGFTSVRADSYGIHRRH